MKPWLIVLIAVYSSAIFADIWTDPVTGIKWTYRKLGNEISLGAGYDDPAISQDISGPLAIPSEIDGYAVTEIGNAAFRNCYGLTDISIPLSVRSIQNNAFFSCSMLTNALISSCVTNIGGSVFAFCSKLENIVVADGNSFYASINGVLFNKEKNILKSCPNGKSGLYEIPESVVEISHHAFMLCKKLTTVLVSENVESIGEGAFTDCYGLEAIVVNEKNDTYSACDGVLFDKNQNKLICCPAGKKGDYTIPSNVSEICDYGFYYCTKLTSIAIPEGVVKIGDSAFVACDMLTELQLPASVTSIKYNAFHGCSALMSFFVSEKNNLFSTVDGVLFNKAKTNLICFPSGRSGAYEVPKSILKIDNYAFYECKEVSHITIGSGVTNIGYWAFSYCDHLTSLDFEGAPPVNLQIANIKSTINIRYNSEYAEEWLPVIAECGFTNASPYTPPKYDGGPYVETVEGAEWAFVVTNLESIVKGGDVVSGSVTIPSTLGGRPVTAIDHSAFTDCGEMTSVTIPASVTEIGSEAFSGCEKLADVWFEGNTIGKIGRHAFLGCYWDLIMHVPADWQGRGRTIAGYTVWRGESSDVEKCVNMTVTNVVVQYVLNSMRPEIAVPVSNSVGFVNIITEVASSGAVSVPTEWKDNYQQFETKFGTDFGKALAMKAGKKDGAGNDMFVWQDFVAGTDPTDENDVFTASITIVNGVPVISYTPELTAEQAALRVYKTYGKMKLTDTAWTDITAKTSEERANYNFFKVTVEMK